MVALVFDLIVLAAIVYFVAKNVKADSARRKYEETFCVKVILAGNNAAKKRRFVFLMQQRGICNIGHGMMVS